MASTEEIYETGIKILKYTKIIIIILGIIASIIGLRIFPINIKLCFGSNMCENMCERSNINVC